MMDDTCVGNDIRIFRFEIESNKVQKRFSSKQIKKHFEKGLKMKTVMLEVKLENVTSKVSTKFQNVQFPKR